ncbi:MAG: nucleoside 2-deoxyribosyltransferase [Chloroflexi bacterium]|nr:nucleoside 2-deoxyribosyltransferase [Chloroflexota bacterium]
MNIYFSCSITGGRNEETTYQAIVKDMLGHGHEIPTAHLASSEVTQADREIQPKDIYIRDMNWLENCDAVVAEVTTPSHGVGYEIATALFFKKPVLCCFKKGVKISAIILGNLNPQLKIRSYSNDQEVLTIVRDFLATINIRD